MSLCHFSRQNFSKGRWCYRSSWPGPQRSVCGRDRSCSQTTGWQWNVSRSFLIRDLCLTAAEAAVLSSLLLYVLISFSREPVKLCFVPCTLLTDICFVEAVNVIVFTIICSNDMFCMYYVVNSVLWRSLTWKQPHMCRHACMHINRHAHTHTHARTHACMHVCTHARTHTHTGTMSWLMVFCCVQNDWGRPQDSGDYGTSDVSYRHLWWR